MLSSRQVRVVRSRNKKRQAVFISRIFVLLQIQIHRKHRFQCRPILLFCCCTAVCPIENIVYLLCLRTGDIAQTGGSNKWSDDLLHFIVVVCKQGEHNFHSRRLCMFGYIFFKTNYTNGLLLCLFSIFKVQPATNTQ